MTNMRTVLAILAIMAFAIGGAAQVIAAQDLSDSFDGTLERVIVEGGPGYQPIDNPAHMLNIYLGFMIGWTGFAGVITLIHAVMAGYEYMTAAGDMDKVTNAKKRIRNVIIGITILIAGYVIASVVFYWAGYFTNYPLDASS